MKFDPLVSAPTCATRPEMTHETCPVVYLAGPMTNYPDFNYPMFNMVAKRLRMFGYEVLNPAEHFGGDTTRPYTDYMHAAVSDVLSCDGIMLLPGYEESNGVLTELTVATALGLSVYCAQTLLPIQNALANCRANQRKAADETALMEAQRLVHGDRGEDYGHPLDDMSRTALIWEAILDIPVTAEQVALCMVGVKISRQCHAPKRDNLVDGAGYFETISMMQDKRAEIAKRLISTLP